MYLPRNYIAIATFLFFVNTDLQKIVTLLCWLVLCTTAVAIDIEIDSINGHDNETCYSTNGGVCRTLDYVLVNGLKSFTTIEIHEGVYNITLNNLSFHYITNVTISGAGYKLTLIKCSFGTGLGFFNARNLTLSNFTLLGGGRIMNSTSINTTNDEVAVFRVALYLLDCSDVTIEGLIITNSTGAGLAMYDVTGKVDITNSVFQYNIPLETEELPGDGGVSILFTHCKSGDTQLCNEITRTNYTTYNIQKCSFLSNIATSSESTRLFRPSPYSTVHQQFGYGGGLTIMMRGIAQYNTVTIKDCKFLYNQAVWGGGLFVGLLDESASNRLVLDNVLFDSNFVSSNKSLNITGTGGGAMKISLTPIALIQNYNSSFRFTGCIFINNVADLGGGIAFELSRETPRTSDIYFTNCTWQHNVGHLGSAIYAYVYIYPFGHVIDFNIDSCHFIENSNDYSVHPVKPLGLGAIYLWSVPVSFTSKNVFIGNYGSALVGISMWCIFQNETVVEFKKNSAENGGAITLLGNSYLILFENTVLNFTQNMATGKGGAIYAVTNDHQSFTSSRVCFIFFNDFTLSPYKWKQKNITIYFADNSATYGSSIFTSTLLTCVWGELMKIDIQEIKQVYYWNGTFMYKGVFNVNDLKKEISSDAASIENLRNSSYIFPPGKLYNFDLVAKNDREEVVDTVYFATTTDSSVAVVDDTYSYTSESDTVINGELGSQFDLKMVTVNSLPLSISIGVKLDDNCPPGFYPSTEAKSHKTICECSVNVADQEYFGIEECDSVNMTAYLTSSYFAGYRMFDDKNVLLTSNCPEGYCYHGTGSSIKLPPNSSSEALDDTVCRPQKRTGMLCGKCSEGNYVFINSPNYSFECGPCYMPLWKEIVLLFVAKYIPLTIFVIIIGFFNISLLNGPLNSFVLFSQLLLFMDIYAGGRITILNQPVVKAYRFLYGMWNLNFFEILLPSFCVLRTQSALNMLLFDNSITFLYIGILTTVIYLIGKYYDKKVHKDKQRCLCINKVAGTIRSFVVGENKPSFRIQGLLTLIILCYTKLTALGFYLLSSTTLYGPSKEDSEYHHKVFWLDGTEDFAFKDNWYYILTAIICLIIVLMIPLPVFFYPLLKRSNQLDDNRVYDAFQDQYKNNPIAGCFSAFYFLCRISVLALCAFTSFTAHQFFGLSSLYLFLLTVHCLFQPFKNRFYNVVDMSMFINLTLISVISLFRLYAVDMGLSETVKSFVCQTILIYLPLAYVILLAIWRRYLQPYKINNKTRDGLPNSLRKLYQFTEYSDNVNLYTQVNANESEDE